MSEMGWVEVVVEMEVVACRVSALRKQTTPVTRELLSASAGPRRNQKSSSPQDLGAAASTIES